jgi:hypothetical protein
MMHFIRLLAAMAAFAAFDSAATPFWGAKHSVPADTPVDALMPGEFIWEGGLEPEGPVVVVVSLPEQMAYVYRNGVRIGAIGLPRNAGEPAEATDQNPRARVDAPAGFSDTLNQLLDVGATLLVTDAPVLEHTTGPSLYVMRSGLPDDQPEATSPDVSDWTGPAPVEAVLIN